MVHLCHSLMLGHLRTVMWWNRCVGIFIRAASHGLCICASLMWFVALAGPKSTSHPYGTEANAREASQSSACVERRDNRRVGQLHASISLGRGTGVIRPEIPSEEADTEDLYMTTLAFVRIKAETSSLVGRPVGQQNPWLNESYDGSQACLGVSHSDVHTNSPLRLHI